MVRSPCIEKNGLKKGAWTKEEDKKLIDYITRYGHWNWQLLPKFAGLERCGKSCRLRWLNYLRPNLKRGNYTQQEDETIIKLHRNLGSRWSVIAAQLPGRSDNEIKNHWNTNLKKRSQQDSNPFQSLHTSQDLSPSSSTTTEYITVSNKENLVTEDECAFWDADIDLMSRNFSLETYMLNISYLPDETDHFSQVELWSNDI